ncbi:hypothetical protein ACFLTJ_00345, partial [Chloroflexota bacterium]
MKNKKITKILGFGLSTGLVFASLATIFASPVPVAAGSLEWGTVNTPSWADHVIEEGADIFHYDIGGDDGNTIIAVGEIAGSQSPLEHATALGSQGLTGSFDVGEGEINVTSINSTTFDISGSAWGEACYLRGTFTAILDVSMDDYFGFGYGADDTAHAFAAITGEITHGEPDMLTFSGKLHLDPADALVDPSVIEGPQDWSGWLCIQDWLLNGGLGGPFEFGDFSINSNPFTDPDSFDPGDPAGYALSIVRMPRVWRSDDGGVTWSDITTDVQDADNLPGPFTQFFYGGVGIAPDDEDWGAISGGAFNPDFIGMADADGLGLDWTGIPTTVASRDGGANFSYAGDMNDTGNSTWMARIYDTDVSIETDSGIHIIAVSGVSDPDLSSWGDGTGLGSVFRLDTGTWLSGNWEDTSFYGGWDTGVGDPPTWGVVTGEFSPNFDIDDTFVCAGVDDDGEVYVQSGIWESGAWNDDAGFPNAVHITADGDTIISGVAMFAVGLALPDDYDGSDPGARAIYIYVDGSNMVTDLVGGFLMRIDNGSVSEPYGPSGNTLLASIDFHGDADTGKMIIGEMIRWDNDDDSWGDLFEDFGSPQIAEPCAGVRVWHTVELDPCCPNWELACKSPSGPYNALVMYTPDGDKEYAATMGTVDWEYFGGILGPNLFPALMLSPDDAQFFFPAPPFGDYPSSIAFGVPQDIQIGLSDESAFSVSRDDAVSFNQIGLIDTDIDNLADVAICPDCSVIYLATVNKTDEWDCCSEGPFDVMEVFECDSVWRSYDDGDTWERIFHGEWTEGLRQNSLLLRLPCDAIDDCCDADPVSPSGTVYLGIGGTNDIFYSRDCGQCWNDPPAT